MVAASCDSEGIADPSADIKGPRVCRRGGALVPPPHNALSCVCRAVACGSAVRVPPAPARRGPGSLGSVRERGFSYEDSAGYNEQYFRDVMKRINTKPVERISEEQILAARERRRQELQEERVDLDEIEIPKEHPWAVKESTTPEEQEEIRVS